MQARRQRWLDSRTTAVWTIGFALAFCLGCRSDQANNDGGTPSVPGSARIAWTQYAASFSALQLLSYRVYVDNTRMSLSDVSCSQTPVPGGWDCSGRLPSMSPGRHVLHLTSVLHNVESERSLPLTITTAESTQLPSVESNELDEGEEPVPESSIVCISELQQCYDSRVVGSGFDSVAALSTLPDGRLLFIEGRARVRVIDGETLLPEPALTAPDAGTEFAGLAVDTQFARTRSVFVASSRPTLEGQAALTITRYREIAGTLGEGAVIVTGLAAREGAPAPLAVDAAGMLYVAVPGAVLRFSRDGFVPASNAGGLPAVARGYAQPTSLAIDLARGQIWLAGHDPEWPSAISRLSLVRGAFHLEPIAAALPEPEQSEPSLTLMHAARGQEPWLLVGAGGRLVRGTADGHGGIAELSPLTIDTAVRLRSPAPSLNGSWYVVAGSEPKLAILRLARR